MVMGSQSAPAGQRYRMLVMGAEEADGLKGWTCEPLKRMLDAEEKKRDAAAAPPR